MALKVKLAVMVGLVIAVLGEASHAYAVDQASWRLAQNIGHSNSVKRTALSRDGRWLASWDIGREIKIWEVGSGRLLKTIPRVEKRAYKGTIEFSFDGASLLIASSEGRLQLLNWQTEQALFSVGAEDAEETMAAFAQNGRLLISRYYGLDPDGYQTSLIVRDARTFATLHKIFPRKSGGDKSGFDAWAVSPDGRTVAIDAADSVQLFDLESARLIKNIERPLDGSGTLRFSPDGRFIAGVRDDRDEAIQIWDAVTGKFVRTLRVYPRIADANYNRHPYAEWKKREIYDVRFLQDGKRLVSTGRDYKFRVWDFTTGTKEKEIDSVRAGPIELSPDGRTMFLTDYGVMVVNPETFALEKVFGRANDEALGAAFSADGKSLYSGWTRQGELRQWSLETGALVGTIGDEATRHKESVSSIWLASGGSTIVSRDLGGAINLWEAASGKLIRTWQSHPKNGKFQALNAASSPDSSFVLTGGPDQMVDIWPLDGSKPLKIFKGHTKIVSSVAYAENGRKVASASFGGGAEVMVWDTEKNKLDRSIKPPENLPPIWSVALSPSGNRVAWGNILGSVFVADGSGTRKLLEGKTANFLKFRGESQILVAGDDNAVRLIDANSGAQIWSFNEHSGRVKNVEIRDNMVASSGSDGIRIWRLDERKTLATILKGVDGEWLVITPEGFFSASSKGAGLLHLVRGGEAVGIDQFYNQLYRPDLVREKLAGDPNGKVREAAARLDLTKAAASGSAPRVTIASPAPGTKVQGEQATVEADITDQGGGIGKVEWRVNGVTLGVEERGVKRTDQGSAKSIKVSRELGLTPGENRIAVLAYNEAGLIASEPAEIVVTSVQQGTAKPRLYVLAVGVNDYWDSALKLSYAAPDAKKLGDGFRQAGIQLYEQVEVRTVLDAEATAEKLNGVFTELAKKVRPQDVFVFFLAGHGKTVDARFYFLPQDFRYAGEDSIVKKGVGQNQLQDWVSRIKAQKSVLLFDACESGSLVGDRIAMRGIEEKTAIDRMTRAMGRTVLTATTDSKPAIEGYRGHGVFTYTLLAGFEAADANADGVVDVTELATYVDRRLPDLTYDAFRLRQVPQMSIVGSNFPLASKVALLPADGTSASSTADAIPAKPTHVVIAPAQVRQSAAQTGALISELPAGTQVAVIKREGGWIIIAREGKQLGYVEEKALAALQ